MVIVNFYRYNLINYNLSRISFNKTLFKAYTINNSPPILKKKIKKINNYPKPIILDNENNPTYARSSKEPENIDINDINYSVTFWNKWKDNK